MYELKIGKVFTSKFVGTGPSSYKKRIYRAAVSQRLRNTVAVTYTISLHLPTLSAIQPIQDLCRASVNGQKLLKVL